MSLIFRNFLLLGFTLLTWGTALAEGLDTTINKDEKGRWTVLYSANKPIQRIAFIRNPDGSRVQRWNVNDKDLEVVIENGQEYIVSKTNTLFQTASVRLTPTYKHLSKDYAPFSPFSDGSTLLHSARLFACENSCDNELNEWKITVNAPKDNYIIVDGKVHHSSASWLDNSDGKNIYVGHQQPLVTDNFISVIDEGLPDEIKMSLQVDIPKMMSYLESKLGKLATTQKPSLFASYAKVDGTSVQGGVLPNQIFIHWNRNNLEKQVGDEKFINDLLWTFAHEAGHFYQQFENLVPQKEDSWIHEGHAEMLAFDTLKHLYPESQNFLNRKRKIFKDQCAKGLSEMSLKDAALNGRFSLYYSCGFLIHQAIENASNRTSDQEHSAYKTWNHFREKAGKDTTKGKTLFLETVGDLTNKELVKKIDQFVNLRHRDPPNAIEMLDTP